jgi:alanine dehydrogenase
LIQLVNYIILDIIQHQKNIVAMIQQESSGTRFTFGKATLLPQEEMLEVKKSRKQLTIGIPREDQKNESRVALTPEAVEQLVDQGHQVIIESEAGKSANYQNTDYSECGGIIVEEKKQVFQTDIILKIAPLTLEEIEMLQEQKING